MRRVTVDQDIGVIGTVENIPMSTIKIIIIV